MKQQRIDAHLIDTIKMAILIVIVFSLANLAHHYLNLRVFRENMVARALQETTSYIPKVVKDVNNTYAYTSKILAELYSQRIQYGYDVDEILHNLQTKQQALKVKQIGLVDIRSNLYIDTFGRKLQLDVNSERDSWVQEFINNPNDYRYGFYDPDQAEYESLYSFYHDQKIIDSNGETIGILGIGLDYESLYRRIQGMDDSINVSFLTLAGEIRLPKSDKGQSVFDLYPSLTSAQFNSIRMQDQIIWDNRYSENYLVYLHYLADINRVLLLKIDNTDYYNQSRKQYFYSFLIGLVLVFTVAILNLIYIFYQSKRLNRSAFYDSLTGCHNRNYLENRVKLNSFWRQVTQRNCTLAVFDIDHFKLVNDTFGHLQGDQVLKQVATVVRNCLRERDEFIRWGGDEFLILLEMDAQEATQVANRIRQRVEQETSVTLSIGITHIAVKDSFQSAMARADSALYQAKEKGRNQVRLAPADAGV